MGELSGLTEAEVSERRRRGDGEQQEQSITKSRSRIIREHLFTLFNGLNFLIAALLFAVGAYSNMLFISIIILNLLIGIFQELQAKKMVDELSILNRPSVRVRRGGEEKMIPLSEVVRDDLILLGSGDQICSDSVVLEGEIEVNESLLTGESDGVSKKAGDSLLSGSFVIAGKACAEVVHVGTENYASALAAEVKKEKQMYSELSDSMKRVTRVTSCFIIPLSLLLLLEACLFRQASVEEAVVTSAAALLGMLPKGLALLISVSLAAGVIRLGKKRILVQNLYSLETLAHVDTLCLDKTGTLTDGRLKVGRKVLMPALPERVADGLIQSYTAVCDDRNATFQALKEAFPPKQVYQPIHKIPFSSSRKWGSISFDGMGTVFVGAPEKFSMNNLPENLDEELEAGKRILVVGYSVELWEDEKTIPQTARPLYCLVLEDTIRCNAKKTLDFFQREQVAVKIISGDHKKTVSAIARQAGLDGWDRAVDLSLEGETPDYDKLCRDYTIFARATPKQKQELVLALKRQGHQVAMTGDGVNDLLALKEADCSIAVADGSDASRQLASVVLLDSDFTHLPQVVMEGRRVIHNVTRTAGVFFIKTIYSVLVSLLCLVMNFPFPFIPIQITLIDAFVEAYPSFLTILEADTRRVKGSFLRTAFANALPFGLAAAAMILLVSAVSPFSTEENRTVMYLSLILISIIAVGKSCIPFTPLRVFICITMAAGMIGALRLLSNLFQITAVSQDMAFWILAIMAAVWGIFMMEGGMKHLMGDRTSDPDPAERDGGGR